MIVSGMSGNEIYCLNEKGYAPSEIVVGNSVCSLGVLGNIGAGVRGMTGGEVANVTQLISEGRHRAIERMEKEAQKHGAQGVTSVVSELRTLSGYMEFLSQGTAILGEPGERAPFSTAASGMELYCHLDAGYRPVRFAMGNVAYALGLGRGLVGSLRTMGRGEVSEFSQMYNHIRHLALERLRKEAAGLGANAVVDVHVRLLPFGASVELLMTGTASRHPLLPAPSAETVVTSELSGEELWNLAKMGYAPVQLCMATSVYSLGVVGGLGAMFRGMTRGELPELTALIYEARENCVELLRKEAERYGAERVIGNKLAIRELSPGLIEVMAVGTAVRKAEDMLPAAPALIPQAIIVDRASLEADALHAGGRGMPATPMQPLAREGGSAQANPLGCLIALVVTTLAVGLPLCAGLLAALLEG